MGILRTCMGCDTRREDDVGTASAKGTDGDFRSSAECVYRDRNGMCANNSMRSQIL